VRFKVFGNLIGFKDQQESDQENAKLPYASPLLSEASDAFFLRKTAPFSKLIRILFRKLPIPIESPREASEQAHI